MVQFLFYLFIYFFYFNWFLEKEEQRGRERNIEYKNETSIGCLLCDLYWDRAHNPCLCLDQESNRQPFSERDNGQPNWATPIRTWFHFLHEQNIKCLSILFKLIKFHPNKWSVILNGSFLCLRLLASRQSFLFEGIDFDNIKWLQGYCQQLMMREGNRS